MDIFDAYIVKKNYAVLQLSLKKSTDLARQVI